MPQRLSSSTVLAIALIAVLALAMASPAPAPIPADIKAGSTLYNLNTVRSLSGSLQGFTAGSPVDVKEVRGSWISIEYQGSQKKETWLNFEHVISYRTVR